MDRSSDASIFESPQKTPLSYLFWNHLKSSFFLWPIWWRTQKLSRKTLPITLALFYFLILQHLNGLKSDHVILCSILLFLHYSGPLFKSLYQFLVPFFLTALVYDSQRYYSHLIRGPIHVSEPYQFDRFFFGIQTSNGVLTPNEWWQLHTHPILDLMTGFAYLVFFSVFILHAAYFRFILGKRGTTHLTALELTHHAQMMPWGFFWLNLMGYSTYYWYAAAPPWYVTQYGLGPAQLVATASTAGCARFDQLLGTHFFTEMYGRSADVFGAIPSLHVAYPLLATFFAFQFRSSRIFSVLFYLLMCFSAVYLNHHYVLDILWGSTYALMMGWLMMMHSRRTLPHAIRAEVSTSPSPMKDFYTA